MRERGFGWAAIICECSHFLRRGSWERIGGWGVQILKTLRSRCKNAGVVKGALSREGSPYPMNSWSIRYRDSLKRIVNSGIGVVSPPSM